MKKILFTTILLTAGVCCLTFGIHANSIIMSILGGFFLGVYNYIHNKYDGGITVKEVDLEKEMQDIHKHFHDYYGIVDSDTGEFAKVEDMVEIAKHFYELGLKTKKGE